MESIKIGTNLPKEKISDIILSYPFNNKVNVQCDSFENREVYSFNINKKMLEDVVLYSSIANLTQNIINKLYMKELIDKKVSIILKDFYDSDIEEVKHTVYDLLLDDDYFTKEKEQINSELKDYLIENNTLIIDGYLLFRSSSFENLIDQIIQKVMFDVQMESEYEEFVYMLQYYLDSQVPKIDTVNIIIRDGQYFLMDSNNKPLESPTVHSIIDEFGIDDISQADILVTSLIILAPNKVVVHIKNDNEQDLMAILKKIFTNRLSFCYSCNICDINIIEKEHNKS